MISINLSSLNRCDYYLILWVIYYLQGILYPSGGIISVLLLAILLSCSFYYMKEVLYNYKTPIFINGLTFLVILFSIYGLLCIIENPGLFYYKSSHASIRSYFYLKQIYLSLLPIYSFYYFSKEGYLTLERFRNWIFIFFLSVVLSYFRNQIETQRSLEQEEITNNMGYLFVGLVPSLLLFKKNVLKQYIGLMIVFIFIVLGMKRGAIIIGSLCILFVIKDALIEVSFKMKVIILGMTLVFFVAAALFLYHQMSTSEYLLSRIQQTQEGNLSNRDIIYQNLWRAFINGSDPIHIFFGHGAYGTLKIYGTFAHNDWLEIAINQGLCGVIIFIYFFWTLFKTWHEAISFDAKAALLILGFTLFAKSLISMSYEDLTYVESSLFGFYLAKIDSITSDDDGLLILI